MKIKIILAWLSLALISGCALMLPRFLNPLSNRRLSGAHGNRSPQPESANY